MKSAYSPIQLEHDFSACLDRTMRRGWGFDVKKAEALANKIRGEQAEVDEKLQEAFPPLDKIRYTKVKKLPRPYVEVFNPGSRQQIAQRLKDSREWKPKIFTNTGQASVDETILSMLPWPEAKLLAKRFLLAKRLGQIAEGDKAWLKKVKEDGRLYSYIMHIGTVTHRCAHFDPNLGQVPANDAPYGKECRELFIPRAGWVAVGGDASGLELRMLAHYMQDSAYTDEVLHGDPHTVNMRAWEVDDRALGKRLTYACLYGASDTLLGTILGGSRKDGTERRKAFMSNLEPLGRLSTSVKKKAKRGFFTSLDGRKIPIRHTHAALNTLLQAGGAVVMKAATVEFHDACAVAGMIEDMDWGMVGHVHDEMQTEAHPNAVEDLKKHLEDSFIIAGEKLGVRLPINGVAQHGKNWSETH